MADSAALLRMLEPMVRPVQAPGAQLAGGVRPGRGVSQGTPIEQRDFDSLLQEANDLAKAEPTGDGSALQGTEDANGSSQKEVGMHDALSALNQLDRVENASLRRLIEQARGSGETTVDDRDRQA